jgi:hypothetical protein
MLAGAYSIGKFGINPLNALIALAGTMFMLVELGGEQDE